MLLIVNNFETQRSYKTTVNLERLSLKKKISNGFKIIRLFVQVDQNIFKNANNSTLLYANQIPLSCDRLKLFPWSFQARFKSEWNYYEVDKLAFQKRFFS